MTRASSNTIGGRARLEFRTRARGLFPRAEKFAHTRSAAATSEPSPERGALFFFSEEAIFTRRRRDPLPPL